MCNGCTDWYQAVSGGVLNWLRPASRHSKYAAADLFVAIMENHSVDSCFLAAGYTRTQAHCEFAALSCNLSSLNNSLSTTRTAACWASDCLSYPSASSRAHARRMFARSPWMEIWIAHLKTCALRNNKAPEPRSHTEILFLQSNSVYSCTNLSCSN